MESEKRLRESAFSANVNYDAEDKEFLIRQRKGHSTYNFEKHDSERRKTDHGRESRHDPRLSHRANHEHSTNQRSRRRIVSEGRKVKQLCRQVATTLDMVLSGECHHPNLQALRVVAVEPSPNSSRLCVTLAVELPPNEFDPQQVQDQLARQSGRLRAEVAAAICRKRAPSLLFQLLVPSGGSPSLE
ncbi:MAG: hypothetical protein JNK57_17530 [Planctomycetaceae bacterium]|nr:hypothetical protein [Planctomycetaceae bacterium]